MKIFPYVQYRHRAADPDEYLLRLEEVAAANDRHNFAGTLIFTTLDDPDDQWELAGFLARESRQIPVVAVAPNWEHPVITARRIATYQRLFRRPLGINWITGTLLSDYEKLGVALTKDERYRKLAEYIDVVSRLTRGEAVSFSGEFFKVVGHKLKRLPTQPIDQYLSGMSEPSQALARSRPFLAHIGTGLPAGADYPGTMRGLGFGVVARPSAPEADAAFRSQFAADRAAEIYFELAKKNTDSTWKRRLFEGAGDAAGDRGFFAAALRSGADNGCIVGSYQIVADYFKNLLHRGIDVFFVNVPSAAEVIHLSRVVDQIRK